MNNGTNTAAGTPAAEITSKGSNMTAQMA